MGSSRKEDGVAAVSRIALCLAMLGCAAEPRRHEGPPERPTACLPPFHSTCSGQCAGGYCAPACTYDDDCPGGWVCAGTNRITGETFCVVPCDDDADCPWSSCHENRVCSFEITPTDA